MTEINLATDADFTVKLATDPLAHLIATYFDDAIERRNGAPVHNREWLAETAVGLAVQVRHALRVLVAHQLRISNDPDGVTSQPMDGRAEP